jgi:excisionase family DNA binding protein
VARPIMGGLRRALARGPFSRPRHHEGRCRRGTPASDRIAALDRVPARAHTWAPGLPCSRRVHRGRARPTRRRSFATLWPVALHIPIRFHDLRHTFATELLRRGVDSYRVQRLMRHSDVRVTLGTYAHLLVEDLRAAADAHTPLPAMPAAANSAPIEPHALHQEGTTSIDAARISEGDPQPELERETGVEPATLSLGMRTGSSATSRTGWQTSEDRTLGNPNPDARSPGLAGFCTHEAPIEPQSIARHVRSAEATQPGGQRPLRRPQLVSGALAWLTVSDVAKQLRVSSATVYRLIDRGELRHARVSNAIRISPADLAAFLRGGS